MKRHLLVAFLTLIAAIGLAAAPEVASAHDGPGQYSLQSVSAGDRFTCAVRTNGAVACWGRNDYGQLGNGTINQPTHSSTPVPVVGITNAISVTAGADHACALLANGSAKCWGSGLYGRLGAGNDNSSATPVTVVGGARDLISLSAGNEHTCAVRSSGQAVCWGAGGNGQLGNSGTGNANTPVTVSSPNDGFQISAGALHTCLVHNGGGLTCWGANYAGQLGDGTKNQTLVPVGVAGSTQFWTHVAAGYDQTCGQVKTGFTFCWGSNSVGQIGADIPTVPESLVPYSTGVIPTGFGHSSGPGFSCAVQATGRPGCWGSNSSGQFGLPTPAVSRNFVYIPGLQSITIMSAGSSHVCAVAANGSVYCWGSNLLGELGNGTTSTVGTPGIVSGISDAAVGQRTSPVIVDPHRILDTRPTQLIGYQGAKPTAGQVVTLNAIMSTNAASPVQNGAAAVMLNVTATQANGGFVTVWPCDTLRPNASNLNLSPGETAANAVIAKLSSAGTICLYTELGTHLIADVTGWYMPSDRFAPVVPERILDTRPNAQIGYDGARPAASAIVTLQVAGVGTTNIPLTNNGVALNVTAAQADGGFVTVWPCDQPRPDSSNLNIPPGGTRPNLVITKLSQIGTVCIFTEQASHLIADVMAWFPGGPEFTSTTPFRVLDTRPKKVPTLRPAAGQTTTIQLVNTLVPGDATAVVLNVTGTQADGGFVTVWPCGQSLPNASSLNLAPGDTHGNLVITTMGPSNTVCLYTEQATHLIVDVLGWYNRYNGVRL